MNQSLILKGGRVIDPANNRDGYFDVLIEDGKISAIDYDLDRDKARKIDVTGKIVSPGFVEMHAHMREPGDTERETMYYGTCSAAAGGFTSVATMPNTIPVIDTPEKIHLVMNRAKESAVVNIFPMGSVTIGRMGEEIVDMKGMARVGAVAFSDDGNAIKSSVMMKKVLEISKEVNRVIDVHCEDKAYTGNGVVAEGKVADELGLPGISAAAEDMMIARDLIIQEEVQGYLHIAHLGSERAVELVRFFKNRGVKFTCEVIPHQFSLTEDIVKIKGTRAKVKPPFRSQKEVDGIKRGLQDRLIDVVATDHCPYTDEEITCGLTDTNLFGLAGFETTLPLLLRLVHDGMIDYSHAIACLTINPAKALRLDKGTLSVGSDADITIISPDEVWTVDISQFKTKSSNSPYDGHVLKGKVDMTFVSGEMVYQNGDILKKVPKPY